MLRSFAGVVVTAANLISFHAVAQSCLNQCGNSFNACVTRPASCAGNDHRVPHDRGVVIAQALSQCRLACDKPYRTCISGCGNVPDPEKRLICKNGCDGGFDACLRHCLE
jgi:hypothetical protein